MPIPVLTVDQMREWEEATWATGTTEQSVIQQVGRKLAQRALTLTGSGDSILLLAGKGHNGDDARAATEHLTDRTVATFNVQDPAADLAKLQALLGARPALVVDALFGIGLNRPLEEAWIAFVQAINDSGLPILSVDIPSGLSADTGTPIGTAIHAAVTLTIGAPKTGLLTPASAEFVGRLEVATDVGLIPCFHHPDLWWTLPEDFIGFPPPRAIDSHKGNFGHLSIVAGSVGYHGAAVLSARGAQRAGAGLVTLNTHGAAYPVVAAQLQGVMVRPWNPNELDMGDALLAGPGLAAPEAADEIKSSIYKLWRLDGAQPMIADASALDWLPLGPGVPHQPRVITPHPGEAARLLNTSVNSVQADRVKALRTASSNFGDCWVMLKGRHTLIGRSSGEVYVNPSGNSKLAQGGTGDVLAGYLAGLLVQPQLQADPLTTLRYAAWQHGATADLLTARHSNWVVEELAQTIDSVSPNRLP